jgi:hypothetical protein
VNVAPLGLTSKGLRQHREIVVVELMITQDVNNLLILKLGVNPCQAVSTNTYVTRKHHHIRIRRWNIDWPKLQMEVAKDV